MADRVDNGKKSLRKRHAHKKFFGQQLNWRLMAAIPNMQYNQASASLLFAHLYATIQQKSRHKNTTTKSSLVLTNFVPFYLVTEAWCARSLTKGGLGYLGQTTFQV